MSRTHALQSHVFLFSPLPSHLILFIFTMGPPRDVRKIAVDGMYLLVLSIECMLTSVITVAMFAVSNVGLPVLVFSPLLNP